MITYHMQQMILSQQRYITSLTLHSPSRFTNQILFKSKLPYTLDCLNRDFCTMSSDDSANWRGVPLCEMYGSQSPWGAPEFPLVTPGYKHAVLYHIPASGMLDDRPPKPQHGRDKWDQEHVRMPCSNHSLYPVQDNNGESHLKKRWEIIEHALWRPIRNSQELADAILSYNTKFKKIWKFRALHKLFNEYLEEEESQYFFDVTLPEIAKLALALPKLVQSPIPLLKQQQNHSVSLSQQQITSLLANAFFCTFPRRNTTKSTSEYNSYPFINFNRLYETSGSDHVLEKLKCICHYFRRVCTKAGAGVVTFSRRSVPRAECPEWPSQDVALSSLPLHVDPDGTIEDADGLIQVDFANKYLGGGVLNYGCVQEEIRFVICPELMVSMLFTEVLRFNEALLIIGVEQYSSYSGYGQSFQWSGEHRTRAPLDSSRRRRCAVLAIDALPYTDPARQYRGPHLRRELDKAWIGFSFATDPSSSSLNYPGVATGNWGCGAFGGCPRWKSLLQLMAAAVARRPLAYHTFKDYRLRDDLVAMYNYLVNYNVTVGLLYQYMVGFSDKHTLYPDLHEYLRQVIKENAKESQQTNDKSNSDEIKNNQERVTGDQEWVKGNEERVTGNQERVTGIQERVTGNQERVTGNQERVTGNQERVTGNQERVTGKMAADASKEDKTKSSSEECTNEMDLMDISMSSEPSLHDVTSTSEVQQMSKSPDLFASLDEDESLTEIKVQDIHTPSKRKLDKKPSRLVEEMQKLDEQSGRLNLNLSAPSTSPFRHDNGHKRDTDSAMERNVPGDPATELKKRVSRKITDYFSKKPM